MREIKYCLTCVDQNDSVVGMYGVFEKREDLYTYLGLIINKSSYAISINFLSYYDFDDNFDIWVNRVLSKDRVLCIFTENGLKFKIMIHSLK